MRLCFDVIINGCDSFPRNASHHHQFTSAQKNKKLCFFLLTSNGKVKTKPPPAIIFHSSIKYIAVNSALGSGGDERCIAIMHGLYHRKINEQQSSDSLSKTKAKRGIQHPGWFINQEAKTYLGMVYRRRCYTFSGSFDCHSTETTPFILSDICD